MALNYGDNFVYIVKKGETNYNVKDAIAANAIDTLNGNASTEGSVAKAVADAKADLKGTKANGDTTAETIRGAKDYADGLASNYDAAGAANTAEQNAKDYADGLASNYDAAGAADTAKSDVIGDSSTDTKDSKTIEGTRKYVDDKVATLAGTNWEQNAKTVQNIIAEIENSENANGWTTAIDKLAGLGNKTEAVLYTAEEATAYNTEHAEDPDFEAVSEGDVKTAAVPNTVKDYVDAAKAAAISSANSSATSTIVNGVLTLGI